MFDFSYDIHGALTLGLINFNLPTLVKSRFFSYGLVVGNICGRGVGVQNNQTF